MWLVATLLTLPASSFSVSLDQKSKIPGISINLHKIALRVLLLSIMTLLFFLLVVWLFDFP
jgi:hypothetical protein